MGKQVWQPMRLAYVGHVAEALRQGGGKLSPVSDGGDQRKPKGHG